MILGDSQLAPFIAYLNIGVSCLMVILNIFRKITRHKLRILRLEMFDNIPFFTSYNLTTTIFESIAIMMCPLPQLSKKYFCSMNAMIDDQVCYSYNDILHFAQLYKVFFIIRAFSVGSEFANPSSYRACAIYAVENSIPFVFRCIMQEYPFQLIMTLLLVGIAVFGYALRIAETPVSLKDKALDLTGYFDCCWCSMITMTTVGFGDYYPRSTLGRFVMFFNTIYGMIVTSLMVNFVSGKLSLSPVELKAFTLINRLTVVKLIKKKSAEMIAKIGKFYSLKKKEEAVEERNRILNSLITKSSELKELKSEYDSIQDNNIEEDAERSFALVALEIEEMTNLMKKIKESFKKYHDSHKVVNVF